MGREGRERKKEEGKGGRNMKGREGGIGRGRRE